RHAAGFAQLLPEDGRRWVTTIDGESLLTQYEARGVRVVLLTPDISIALAGDALLIAAPGVMSQMLSEKRPQGIVSHSGLAPTASAVFFADFNGMNFNSGLGKMRSATFASEVPCDYQIAARAQLSPEAFIFEVNQPVASLKKLLALDARWDYRSDAHLLSALRRSADAEYMRRLSDNDPDNDVLPEVAEAIFLRFEDSAQSEEEGPFDLSFANSGFFGGSIDQHWEFFESRRPCARLIGAGEELIAYTKKEFYGRRIVTDGSNYYSLSARIFERMFELRDLSFESDEEIEVNLVDEEQLDDLDAALGLRAYWERHAINRLREMYGGTLPNVGEEISMPNVCRAKITIAAEDLTEVRLEGFGHWAVYDSQFGLINASWLPQDDEDEKKSD
ncbi:MAG: hypothetical protein KDB07_11225, partial [Planctomycetes bacterium]|nr:hypothetical protein [Planctomycetota bacterium]